MRTSRKFTPLGKLEIMLLVGGCVVSWSKVGIGGEETEGDEAWWAKQGHDKVGNKVRNIGFNERFSISF
jgi:hypothetical protein